MKIKLATLLLIIALSMGQVSSFGSLDDPNPEIQQISVFNVTGETDQRQNGELIDEDLNNLTIEQKEEFVEYRFDFLIENVGSETWTINDSDELRHEELDMEWSVNDIYYEIDEINEGGTFTNGNVEWDTNQNGSLDPSEQMNASYIVNISSNEVRTYNQYFLANNTADNAGSENFNDLEIFKFGFFDLELENPSESEETFLQINQTFNLNGSLTCREGTCGESTIEPLYNETDELDTVIPETESEPFYTIASNQRTCELNSEESCEFEFEVNATGEIDSEHLLGSLAASNYSQVNEEQTSPRTVEIKAMIIMDLTWDRIDFGLVSPGAENIEAQGNEALEYNITIDEESVDVDNVYTRATNLTSVNDDSYKIGPGNMSVESSETEDRHTLTGFYDLFLTDLSPGDIVNTFYFLNSPEGIISGEYVGEIEFKANSTF